MNATALSQALVTPEVMARVANLLNLQRILDTITAIQDTPAQGAGKEAVPDTDFMTVSTGYKQDERVVGMINGQEVVVGKGGKVLWDHETNPDAFSVRYITTFLDKTVMALRDASLTEVFPAEDFDLAEMCELSETQLDAMAHDAQEYLDGDIYAPGSLAALALRCVIASVALVRAAKPSYDLEGLGFDREYP